MHISSYRIYYEDTDAAGIVYYANYLKFAERARTEWLRALGVNQSDMLEQGIGFVVRHCEADFLMPARLDDMITVETCLEEMSKSRLYIRQIIKRDEQVIVKIKVIIASINHKGKAIRLPQNLFPSH